jgi:hypothetical protein
MKRKIIAVFICATCYAQSVTIINSGSTNTAGFQIVVQKSGMAEYRSQARRTDKDAAPKVISKTIPKPLVERFYSDVMTARPLALLPPQHCMKSVSFGTSLTIHFEHDVSPDLSCGDGGNPKLHALIRDADEIVKLLRYE